MFVLSVARHSDGPLVGVAHMALVEEVRIQREARFRFEIPADEAEGVERLLGLSRLFAIGDVPP
ncbi:hypothetical protein EOD42_23765 [Rhodovarius crocodyli]|uniref:Uncharacterized protein n=1 Tax=Rhodovarius crocodyli TaxID=1979269 RepID=A0A437LXK0_9PROT|nr:hypothetical protein [Rhodovarius crocodyli]RVT90053.1 hypothetical protein EOD42_23765 [Rhodovarius crocodyli]